MFPRSGGAHSMALGENGMVYTWGYNHAFTIANKSAQIHKNNTIKSWTVGKIVKLYDKKG
ncbi:hypothetical protein [Methanocella conradii]|uniref:hypothetical protein n=1 Tax=Methanocella conradii TaxID=1175444 RepID=UPI0034E0D65B